jgi:ubiquinol-cytochrome c reductase cytochrome c1 subunit
LYYLLILPKRRGAQFVATGATVTVVGGLFVRTAFASSGLAPPVQDWNHRGPFKGFDYSRYNFIINDPKLFSVRRGYSVYKQVCSTCHSLERIAFRNFVGTVMTEDEAKAIAASVEIQDGPDEYGEMFMRPGKLSDIVPKPYANENAARFSNNGALPPDLSLITKARVGGEDHVYAVLTGYREPPTGVTIREGLYYNPYFPGGAIAMAQALSDGVVEYDDGTPANISQMAKDVTTFLAWAAEPENDERKRTGLKAMLIFSLMLLPTYFFYKQKWAVVKTRVVSFKKLD